MRHVIKACLCATAVLLTAPALAIGTLYLYGTSLTASVSYYIEPDNTGQTSSNFPASNDNPVRIFFDMFQPVTVTINGQSTPLNFSRDVGVSNAFALHAITVTTATTEPCAGLPGILEFPLSSNQLAAGANVLCLTRV